MFTSKFIELFYLLFQGMLLFQTFFLAILYIITKRKDILYYSIFLLLSAVYFFLNAPNTFFGLDDDSVFNSALYRYSNIPIIVITNLFYILFLKVFFAGIYANKMLHNFFNFIFFLTPVLLVVFFLLRYFEKDTQSIFYIVNLLAAGISVFIISRVFWKRLPKNNAVKYSEATTIKFEASLVKEFLVIAVVDNGKGFDSGKLSNGNGVGNMKKRAVEIDAEYLMESQIGNGTNVTLQLKIPQ